MTIVPAPWFITPSALSTLKPVIMASELAGVLPPAVIRLPFLLSTFTLYVRPASASVPVRVYSTTLEKSTAAPDEGEHLLPAVNVASAVSRVVVSALSSTPETVMVLLSLSITPLYHVPSACTRNVSISACAAIITFMRTLLVVFLSPDTTVNSVKSERSIVFLPSSAGVTSAP